MAEDNRASIALIVGLGNPGAKYDQTRHNAGFWFLDELIHRYGGHWKVESKFHGEAMRVHVNGCDVWLLKPATFMNRSGQSVAALARFFKIPVERVLVVHDELDLDPGVVRLKQGGGHGGHNGLRDIMAQMGSREFYRLRLGVGHPGHRDQVVDYVLNKPSQDDRKAIEDAIWDASRCADDMISGDFAAVMRTLHTKK